MNIIVLFVDKHYDLYSDEETFFADCAKNSWTGDDIFELVESGTEVNFEYCLKNFILDKIFIGLDPLVDGIFSKKRNKRVSILDLMDKMTWTSLAEDEFVAIKTSLLNILRFTVSNSDNRAEAEQKLEEIEKYLNCFNRIF